MFYILAVFKRQTYFEFLKNLITNMTWLKVFCFLWTLSSSSWVSCENYICSLKKICSKLVSVGFTGWNRLDLILFIDSQVTFGVEILEGLIIKKEMQMFLYLQKKLNSVNITNLVFSAACVACGNFVLCFPDESR